MNRRRWAAGLLGLLALSLSLAEAGAASVCDPSMPMQRDGEVATSHADGMAGHVAADVRAAHPEAPEVAEDGADPPPCPWMPMMGAGCTVPVVPPSPSSEFGTSGARFVMEFRACRDLATLHSTDPLRRPPRA